MSETRPSRSGWLALFLEEILTRGRGVPVDTGHDRRRSPSTRADRLFDRNRDLRSFPVSQFGRRPSPPCETNWPTSRSAGLVVIENAGGSGCQDDGTEIEQGAAGRPGGTELEPLRPGAEGDLADEDRLVA